MNRVAKRATIALLLVFALLGGFAFFIFEYVTQADSWVVFPGSPHLYNGGNIGYGAVVDRNNTLLLKMDEGRAYSNSELLRKATVHWLGDRNGSVSAPALPNYAAELAGFDLLSGIYTYDKSGCVATLTLLDKAQIAALEALGDKKGAVGVYNYKTGELICAVSTPTFDPDNVPDISNNTDGVYDGIFVNRFIQSCYVPGSIFKIVTLATALETIPDIQTQTFVCEGTYRMGVDEITCEGAHWNQSLKEAFRNSCNCAFAQITEQIGGETLQRYAEQFGIVDVLSFDGITIRAGNFDVTDAAAVNVAWAGIGQYTDQINPCAFMTFVGAIAGEGKGVVPYLVQQITAGGTETYQGKTFRNSRIMSANTAKIIGEYMGFNVTDKYGSENFPGLTVCAKTGTAEVGGDKKPNAMLAGFVADESCPLAFIVAVEDAGYGSEVCIPIISAVLEQCREELSRS